MGLASSPVPALKPSYNPRLAPHPHLLLPCIQPHHHHPLVCLRSRSLGLPLPVSRPLPHSISCIPSPFPCSSPSPGTNSGCPPTPPSPPSPPCCSPLHPTRNSRCAALGRNSGCTYPGRNSGSASPPQPASCHRFRSRHGRPDSFAIATRPVLAHLDTNPTSTWGPETPLCGFPPRHYPPGERL